MSDVIYGVVCSRGDTHGMYDDSESARTQAYHKAKANRNPRVRSFEVVRDDGDSRIVLIRYRTDVKITNEVSISYRSPV